MVESLGRLAFVCSSVPLALVPICSLACKLATRKRSAGPGRHGRRKRKLITATRQARECGTGAACTVLVPTLATFFSSGTAPTGRTDKQNEDTRARACTLTTGSSAGA